MIEHLTGVGYWYEIGQYICYGIILYSVIVVLNILHKNKKKYMR